MLSARKSLASEERSAFISRRRSLSRTPLAERTSKIPFAKSVNEENFDASRGNSSNRKRSNKKRSSKKEDREQPLSEKKRSQKERSARKRKKKSQKSSTKSEPSGVVDEVGVPFLRICIIPQLGRHPFLSVAVYVQVTHFARAGLH